MGDKVRERKIEGNKTRAAVSGDAMWNIPRWEGELTG